jgi:ectoine hydroxylase-related dioxygenase (phytanoyl-CoA dioxygenase family)
MVSLRFFTVLATVGFILLPCLLFDVVACFHVTRPTWETTTPAALARRAKTFTSSLFSSYTSSDPAAYDLLYQDQQDSMLRRALYEQELLSKRKTKELLAPKLVLAKPKSGTGFGGSASNKVNSDPRVRLATQQAAVVIKEGVIRINNVISAATADRLRHHVLEQQQIAAFETERDISTSTTYYGVENRRQSRCDLQLSLRRGGFADGLHGDASTATSTTFALGDALQEMLGSDGTLRHLYENLVTFDGELYELAAVITDPGSNRQMIHPDLPYQAVAPLYVIFLALQDVTEGMGPTCFLLRSHTGEANAIFSSGNMEQKDEQLSNAESRLCTLKKGDAVLFDARTLHCGNANLEQTRVLFNFSFRNPLVTGDLGYKGSIRPEYEGAISLRGMADALEAYGSGDENPFAKYV